MLDKKQIIFLIKEDDKNKISQNRWNLLGSSVDNNESLPDSVQRETLEETGYQSKMQSVLGIYLGSKDNQSWFYMVHPDMKNV